jgi:phage-related protein
MTTRTATARIIGQQTVTNTLREIDGALDNTGSNANRFASIMNIALGNVVANAFSGMVSFATDKMRELGTVIAEAEPIANIGRSFEAFTSGLEGGADNMLAALQRASGGMVTNTDLMTSFNKAAQLVGIDFAQRLPDAMGVLGKVAGATGEDVGFLLNSLVTGVGRLSPMILDNLGIQVDLNAAYQTYAEKIGKSVDQLSKQEQQVALTDEALRLLGQNTENLPDVSGRFQRLTTALQNKREEIGQRLLPVVEPFLDIILRLVDGTGLWTDKLGSFLDRIQRAGEVLRDTGNATQALAILLGDWVLIAIPQLQRIGEKVAEIMSAVWEIIRNTLDQVVIFWSENGERIISIATDLWTRVLDIIVQAVELLAPHIETAVQLGLLLIETLLNLWDEHGEAIKQKARDIVDAVILKWNQMLEAIDTAKQRYEEVKVIVNDVMEAIRDKVNEVLDAVSDKWQLNSENLTEKATTAWTAIETTVSNALDNIQTFIDTVTQVIDTIWANHGDQIERIAAKAWTAIKLLIEATLRLIAIIIGASILGIANIIDTFITNIRIGWMLWGDDIVRITDAAFGLVLDAIETILDITILTLEGFISLFKGDWDGFLESMKSAWALNWFTINLIIANIKQTLLDTLQGVIDGIFNKWNEIDWKQLGKDIAQGIIDGLSSMVDAVWQSAKDVASAAWNAVQETLGMESPSKVMMRGGEIAGQSLGMGLEKSIESVERAASRLASVVYAPLPRTPATGGLTGAGDFARRRVIIDHNFRVDATGRSRSALTPDGLSAIIGNTRTDMQRIGRELELTLA